MSPVRVRGAVLVVGLMALVAGACGVPTDGRLHALQESEVPFDLSEPTTTADDGSLQSTTTTSPVAVPSTGAAEPPVPAEWVSLYFATEKDLVRVNRWLPLPVGTDVMLAALTSGPQPEEVEAAKKADAGSARSVIGEDDVEVITTRAGVAAVELGAGFAELPASEQRLAVAQLVLTLTDRPGIGQVIFRVDGEDVDVPRADGSLAKAPVSQEDYAGLLRPSA